MIKFFTIGFFSFCIIISLQEEYIDVCFIIYGEKEKDLNLKLNKKLMFIPNILKLYISTTENTYDKKLDTIKRNIYVLAKANHSCSDPFVYEVPWSSQMILTLEMVIYWGEIPGIMIEKNEIVVRPEFEQSYHELDGFLNHIHLKIFLKHEKLNRNNLEQKSYSTQNIDWNGKARELLSSESYCLGLFTFQFFGIFTFSQTPAERGRILKYYRLKTSVFSKNGDVWAPNELEYIAKVFPCHKSLALKDRLKIFIKPTYYKIQFKLFGEFDMPVNIAEYVYHRGRFKLNTTSSNFSFTNLEIKPALFSIDMFISKERMLLYAHNDIFVPFKARIPEVIDNLNVSTLALQYIDHRQVKIYYWKVDMSTHQVGIYKIIRGSDLQNFLP